MINENNTVIYVGPEAAQYLNMSNARLMKLSDPQDPLYQPDLTPHKTSHTFWDTQWTKEQLDKYLSHSTAQLPDDPPSTPPKATSSAKAEENASDKDRTMNKFLHLMSIEDTPVLIRKDVVIMVVKTPQGCALVVNHSSKTSRDFFSTPFEDVVNELEGFE